MDDHTEDPRAELLEALHWACHTAKRAPCILGTPAMPTLWDRAHRHIDDLLDQLRLTDIVG